MRLGRFAIMATLILLGSCTATSGGEEVTGIYYLTRVDGSPVPAQVLHDGTPMRVNSGLFMISEGGRCMSRTTFVPPGSDREESREVHASYRIENGRLIMQWEGAGMTEGTVEGKTFTMDNHGMIFEYEKGS